MSFNNISAGSLEKNQFNVIIEIPSHGQPVKYEVDKETGALFVDRFLNTAMYYPCNYGYIPKTLSEDGDPVDVLVITPVPLICGSVIRVRPIGMLRMSDEAGKDAKILAVPIDKLCQRYQSYQDYNDVDLDLRLTIEHFFEHYKDLEKGKWVKIDGWANTKAALAEISESVNRYLRSTNSQIQETLAHAHEVKPKTKAMKAKVLAPTTRTTAKAKHASPPVQAANKKKTAVASTSKARSSVKTTRQRVK